MSGSVLDQVADVFKCGKRKCYNYGGIFDLLSFRLKYQQIKEQWQKFHHFLHHRGDLCSSGKGVRSVKCGKKGVDVCRKQVRGARPRKAGQRNPHQARRQRRAKYFVEETGRGTDGHKLSEYSQDHKPILQQDEIVGHAVRAGYLYSGVADVAALTHDTAYFNALTRIWENMAGKKLFITGGIGSRPQGEGFGPNYELNNHTAYCETCASIANVYWNHRMFLATGDAKYADVLERALYNGVISGVSLSGDKFF